MTNVQDKAKLVGSILKITKKTGQEKYFDKINDYSQDYLVKLLAVCRNLKKAK
jgi:hypothetical protein